MSRSNGVNFIAPNWRWLLLDSVKVELHQVNISWNYRWELLHLTCFGWCRTASCCLSSLVSSVASVKVTSVSAPPSSLTFLLQKNVAKEWWVFILGGGEGGAVIAKSKNLVGYFQSGAIKLSPTYISVVTDSWYNQKTGTNPWIVWC